MVIIKDRINSKNIEKLELVREIKFIEKNNERIYHVMFLITIQITLLSGVIYNTGFSFSNALIGFAYIGLINIIFISYLMLVLYLKKQKLKIINSEILIEKNNNLDAGAYNE